MMQDVKRKPLYKNIGPTDMRIIGLYTKQRNSVSKSPMNINPMNINPMNAPSSRNTTKVDAPTIKVSAPAPSKSPHSNREATTPLKDVVTAKDKLVWIRASAVAAQSEPVSTKRSRRRASPSGSNSQLEQPDQNTPYEWRQGWMTEGTVNFSVRLKKPLAGEPLELTFPKEKMEEDVLMANDSKVYPHDLVKLPHFHEPAVVECLQHRYSKGLVYTSTGPVLLALNPFRHLPEIYGDDVMKKYWDKAEKSLEEPLPPHVYAIADGSFRSMMRGVEMSLGKRLGGKCDQSILVSGESGAGKTVTTKYLMKYLAALSKRAAHHASEGSWRLTSTSTSKKLPTSSSIESQVLQSNPILESFGNARTIRNDNSSRFGKFIEMQFTSTGRLLGSKIDTYLLEKVRLVSQNPGERNYHVFYELLSGAVPPEELEQLCLDATVKPQDFKILNSGTFDRRDGVSDRDTYKDLRKAMNMMGFTDRERLDVFAVTAAILHASNVTFEEVGSEESAVKKANKHLQPACDLLGVTPEDLNEALCYFLITAGGKSIRRPYIVEKAEKGLDALLKAAYAALFTFLVQKVNESIAFKETPETEVRHVANIGVLDIFGFESFATNSFEQLCINYCNEALQQQFNTFMLKNEQAEYANEGIDWNFIKFPENQDVLDLIDHRTSGIMSILDDTCRAPGGTDNSFASQVYKLCETRERFEVSHQNASSFRFSIHHYAGPVEYTTAGFMEKNRDDLPRETVDLLMKSKNPFVHKLAEIIASSGQVSPASDTEKASKSRRDANNGSSRPSVGGHFRRQVKDLRAKIDTTSPHYVRCIKPNERLAQNCFDDAMVAQQLRCGGILQAVSVTRDGFTLHYTHSDFVKRYRLLTQDKKCKKAPAANRFASKSAMEECKQLVGTMLQKLHKMKVTENNPTDSKTTEANKGAEAEEKLIEFGKTKVLLKHHAFEALERMLGAIQNKSATKLNTIFRRFLALTAFQSARESFRKELQKLGQSFDEWFQEHRALYYQPRQKTGEIEIPDIVSRRLQLYRKNTSETFCSTNSGANIDMPNIVKNRKELYKKSAESFGVATPASPEKKKKVDTEKKFVEINGAWVKNPGYKA
jgi:myosin-5